MRAGTCGLLGLLALVVISSNVAVYGIELEGLDSPADTPIGADATVDQTVFQAGSAEKQHQKADLKQPVGTSRPAAAASAGRRPPFAFPFAARNNHYLEAAVAVISLIYVLISYFGSQANRKIAEAWARQFCLGSDALFPKQFSLCGAGELKDGLRAPLVKESSYLYKFYASGRRHCQGCLASLVLKPRSDLIATLWGLIFPAEDLVEIEVYMHEANCPPMVLAVGTPRQTNALLKNRSDIKSFTRPLKQASPDSVPNWNMQRLNVLAEHSTLFHDLFSEPRLQSVFTAPTHADKLRYFRSLLITSDNSEGSHKRVLRFVFALPPADDMKALAPLMGLVPLLVDLVGVYKLSPELKKRATDARARRDKELADAEEARRKRMEALARRKMEKVLEEKERLARLSPEARRRAEEKLAKQAAKKGMKVKMMRM